MQYIDSHCSQCIYFLAIGFGEYRSVDTHLNDIGREKKIALELNNWILNKNNIKWLLFYKQFKKDFHNSDNIWARKCYKINIGQNKSIEIALFVYL